MVSREVMGTIITRVEGEELAASCAFTRPVPSLRSQRCILTKQAQDFLNWVFSNCSHGAFFSASNGTQVVGGKIITQLSC